ncbi:MULTISPECIES: VOC family protein [Azohydromonas]|uniref:VOC family protein n=1 Tax=Azohydromonas lata TaxID=45677 RepID=A0ABU5I8E5_9BURK|nr:MULTISPECIES: VOC family protein [Azohydromonas]MDZ5455124.1 VOC family protein [Azohydromonas lata]
MSVIDPPSFTEICYVVHDVERAAREWARNVGAGPFYLIEPHDRARLYRGQPCRDPHRVALGSLGTTVVEFIEPLDDTPSIWREILDVKGETVHHVFPDIRLMPPGEYDRRFAAHRAAGLEVVLTGEVEGIGRHAFFDALASMGCFIELLDVGERLWQFTLAQYREHQRFDGQRPLRDMSELLAARGCP